MLRDAGGRAEAFCRLAAYGSSLLVAAPFIYHLMRGSSAYLGLLEDDYFYYANVADNLVSTGRLTYDGSTLTNGFHPLWFCVITLLRLTTGRFGAPYYVALTLICVVAMGLTYELGRRFARELGAPAAVAAVIATLYSVATARLLASGMESIIAVPLLLWFLVEVSQSVPLTAARAAKLGFIGSLAILARLDIALAVALALVGYFALVRPRPAEGFKLLACFGAGGILLPLYTIANWFAFGSPFPVSAAAKHLLVKSGISVGYLRYVAFGTDYGPTIAVILPLGVVALTLLVRQDPLHRPAARFAGAVALCFAAVFFILNALTGWIFFGWYAYPLPAATIAALVFIYQRFARSWASPRTLAVAAGVLVAVSPALAVRYFVEHGPKWSISDNSLLATGYDLARHMQSHDGLLSMGAIAGVVRYVADRPLLQLEGIIADQGMVEHIRRQDPLDQVLRQYHADYLIVSVAGIALERRNGCYLVTEPHAQWAGTRTAKMRGALCSEPIEHFFTEAGANPWSVFPRIESFVWDLRTAHWQDQPL
ncbi:MAG: hypothetical protein ABJD53_09915 [Gammaproteobacteria bacterium]